MASIEEEVVGFVSSLRYEDLPGKVVETVKLLFLNTIAAMLAGSGAKGVVETAGLVCRCGGTQESTVVLKDCRVPAQEAVLVNATMARALDFDEFNVQTGIHAGSTVIPVALAAAELAGTANGKELISAVAAGAELMSRMRMVPDLCIGISGWTGEVFGAFGAAAVAGRILGLTEQEIFNSLGLALSQSSGTAQSIYDGVLGTRLQQGFSARAGMLAARIAAEGVTGAQNFLDGKAGFYPVYYRGIGYDLRRLTDGMGKDYRFLNLATKPYPCCGFIIAPAENLLGLMRENRLTEQNIERIEVLLNEQMYNTVCYPEEAKYKPKNEADAMFSLPYVLGSAMIQGDVWLSDFTVESIKDVKRLSAAGKITVIRDQKIDAESKSLNLALSLHEMRVTTKDGRMLTRKLYHARGFPENPMTMDDCAEKAQKCAVFAVKKVPDRKLKLLRELIEEMEGLSRITELTNILS
jgi:2-methylcitrate dehydratase PrpD